MAARVVGNSTPFPTVDRGYRSTIVSAIDAASGAPSRPRTTTARYLGSELAVESQSRRREGAPGQGQRAAAVAVDGVRQGLVSRVGGRRLREPPLLGELHGRTIQLGRVAQAALVGRHLRLGGHEIELPRLAPRPLDLAGRLVEAALAHGKLVEEAPGRHGCDVSGHRLLRDLPRVRVSPQAPVGVREVREGKGVAGAPRQRLLCLGPPSLVVAETIVEKRERVGGRKSPR